MPKQRAQLVNVARPALSAQLRTIIDERGVSSAELAEAAGVDRRQVERFRAGTRGLHIEAVDRICAALAVELVDPAAGRRKKQGPPLRGTGALPSAISEGFDGEIALGYAKFNPHD